MLAQKLLVNIKAERRLQWVWLSAIPCFTGKDTYQIGKATITDPIVGKPVRLGNGRLLPLTVDGVYRSPDGIGSVSASGYAPFEIRTENLRTSVRFCGCATCGNTLPVHPNGDQLEFNTLSTSKRVYISKSPLSGSWFKRLIDCDVCHEFAFMLHDFKVPQDITRLYMTAEQATGFAQFGGDPEHNKDTYGDPCHPLPGKFIAPVEILRSRA